MQISSLSWPACLVSCLILLTWSGPAESANIQHSRVRRQAPIYNSPVSCPNSFGQFEYPGDCSRYIQCDNNVPTVGNCQPNLVFNPARGYCDFPGEVPNCQPTQRGITSSPSQEVNFDICSAAPNGGDEVTGFEVPHPQICNAFYTCNRNYIYAPCTFCPEHMYFSLPERRCLSNTTGDFQSVCQGREYVAHTDKTYRQLDGTCRDTGGAPGHLFDQGTSNRIPPGGYRVAVPFVAANPVYHPVVNTFLHPAFNTVLHPAVNTVLHPAVNTVLHPAVNTVLHPAVNTVLHPAVNPVVIGRRR